MNTGSRFPAAAFKLSIGAISLLLIAGAAWFVGTTPSRVPAGEETIATSIAAPGSVRSDAPQGRAARAPVTGGSEPRIAGPDARTIANPPDAPRAASKTAHEPAAPQRAQNRPANPAVAGAPFDAGGAGSAAETGVPSAVEMQATGVQTPGVAFLPIAAPEDLVALAATAQPAEEVTSVGDARQTMEEALLAATAKTENPEEPNVKTRDALDRLIGAFVTERDEEAKVDLLAMAEEVARSSGQSLQRLLALALQPRQPADVQQQALYLAARHDPALVQKIAVDPAHPFQLEAEAFLREKRLAAARRIAEKGAAPAER